jgi:putative acetyltransferase
MQRALFGEIWMPWLRDTMGRTPEPEDLAGMDDPASYYRQTGGDAYLAALDGKIVGAIGLKGLGVSGYELCKLIVAESARGHGVGQALIDACLDRSAADGGKTLWLQSSKKLQVARKLYRRMGFRDAAPPPEMNVLGCTEVIMCRSTINEGARLH